MSLRGEVQVTVCGKTLSMAPTFKAIEQIELRLGVGLPHLLSRVLSGDVRMREIAVIVYEGLKGAGHLGKDGRGDVLSYEEIGEDVLINFGELCPRIGTFLGNALGAGGKPEKKA